MTLRGTTDLGQGAMLRTLLCLYLHLSSACTREVRLLQTSLGPCLELRMQPGPLHWAKSRRGQPGNGAWGERTCVGNGARGEGQAPSGQPTNRKGHGRVPSYRDKGPVRGEWGCRRSSGREVSGGTAPGTPRTCGGPWVCSLWCRHPRGHPGTCDWRAREGASTQRGLGLTQEGDGASKR